MVTDALPAAAAPDGAIPAQFTGPGYIQVLREIVLRRDVRRYMEIGVCTGECLAHIACESAIGVDPDFQIRHNVAAGKTVTRLFRMPSDSFFADVDIEAELGGPVDFAFLDGMHLFEYLLRDFYNTERRATPRSLIALHDCLPLAPSMMVRRQEDARRLSAGTPYQDWWTGDVWKIVPILRTYRPDLKVVCVETPPTGLVFVSNLDPDSTALADNYCAIVEAFAAVPNDADSLRRFFAETELVPAARIIDGFDHSLYFRA